MEAAWFTPEQGRLLWQDYLSRQQLQSQLTKNYPQRRPIDEPSPHRVFVLNTTEETIPPFACLRVIGTEVVGERTALKVEKPTSTSGEFLFNGPYPIEAPADAVPATEETDAIPEKLGVGWAYRYGVVVMLGNPPSEPNVSYGPIVDSWEIEEGDGPFTVFGEYEITPDSETAALIGRFAGGGSGGTHWIEFTVVDVYCPGDDDYDDDIGKGRLYVDAEVNWYTGGCSKNPPGFDEYSQTVRIFDSCRGIFKFFTADQLLGESPPYVEPMSGDAVYVYPFGGDECVPEWHVKAVCGVPSCGDSVSPPLPEEDE